MKLVITGASGLIGSALAREAEKNRIEVVKLVRRTPKEKNESQWDPNKGVIDLAALERSPASLITGTSNPLGVSTATAR